MINLLSKVFMGISKCSLVGVYEVDESICETIVSSEDLDLLQIALEKCTHFVFASGRVENFQDWQRYESVEVLG
jgi:hypothetical protein